MWFGQEIGEHFLLGNTRGPITRILGDNISYKVAEKGPLLMFNVSKLESPIYFDRIKLWCPCPINAFLLIVVQQYWKSARYQYKQSISAICTEHIPNIYQYHI